MAVKTPNSAKRYQASSSKKPSLPQRASPLPSPIASMGDTSRESTPELPTEDKSPSPGSEDEEMQDDGQIYDAETQETAIVPDSAQATPVASLPGLTPSAIHVQNRRGNEPTTPSQLSRDHLEVLRNDILMDDGTTLADMVIPFDDDSISLQSDLTIADLDPDDWKQMAISYGAEPRSDDDENGLGALASALSGGSRRCKGASHSLSPRKAARVSTRLGVKAHTPSKSAHHNGAAATPVRSSGRAVKTYGKRGHRPSTSTSSETDLRDKSQRTSGTTSGESSGIEVTTERKAGVLRQVTPDGTILDSNFASTPSRSYSVKKGKGKEKTILETAPSSEDEDDIDMSRSLRRPAKKTIGKSPANIRKDVPRTKRAAKRQRDEIEKTRIRTPSLSPPKEEAAPFVPLTTATEGKALSAMEIIAQMRAKNKVAEESEEEEVVAALQPDENDANLDLYSTTNLLRKSTDMPMDDSDEDDLMDTKELLNRAKNAPRKKKDTSPVSTTSAQAPSTNDVSKYTQKVKLPKDKASQALERLFKARQAQEARGWFGMDEAARVEAETSKRSTSNSPEKAGTGKTGSASSDSDASGSSSLPDAPPITAKTEGSSAQRTKKARRYSNGQLKRVVGHLAKNKEDEGVVEAIKAAQDELEEAQLRAKRKREQEKRQFWKKQAIEDLKIEPFKPYEIAGTKGLDYALRQGILDGIADPMNFPVELVSPYLMAEATLLSSIPATYSLYQLVAHPCTDIRLANRVLPLLQTLLHKIPSGKALDVDIDLSTIVDSLNAMGAKKDSFTDEMKSSAAIETTPEAMVVDGVEKITFSVEGRQLATARILLVLQALLDTQRVERSQYSSLVILLLRMALDTSDHRMRDASTRTLHKILHRLDDHAVLLSIVQDVLELVTPLSFRDRYVVLSFFPLDAENERSLVRGLCYQLLFPDKRSIELISGGNSISLLSSTLANRPPLSIFYITSTTDDTSLYYAVLILQYFMTDLSKYLIEDVYTTDDATCKSASKSRDDAQSLVSSLTDIDSKIRTDVRSGNPMRNKAKNALARTQHTLEYHLQSAKARADKVSLHRRLGQRTLAEPVEGKVGPGQIAINSYFAKAAPAGKPAVTATTVTSH